LFPFSFPGSSLLLLPLIFLPHPQEGGGLAAGGMRSLFDGKSLEGWTDRGGRYDGEARWSVEDGAIVGRQGEGRRGGLLYTVESFESFDFSCECRTEAPFDSGIFLNMVPGARGLQVTLDDRPGGEIAGIYSDGWLRHNPSGKKAWKAGAWNRIEIRRTGLRPHLRVRINGVLVLDWVQEGKLEGFAREGRIGLQVHPGRIGRPEAAVRFRKLKIRELPTVDEDLFLVDGKGFLVPTAEAERLGWRPLFDGKSLSGFEAVPGGSGEKVKGYRVEGGLLLFPKEGPGGYLRTVEDFEDFELLLEFRTAFMANSGVFLRAARDGSNPAFSGCEIQILDDFNWERVTKSRLKPWQFTGSLYGSVPPGDRGALRPLGRWNLFRIRFRGSRLRTELNGRLLYDVDTLRVPGKPFAERAKRGFLGLQRHAPREVRDEIYAAFRNLWVRPLKRAEVRGKGDRGREGGEEGSGAERRKGGE